MCHFAILKGHPVLPGVNFLFRGIFLARRLAGRDFPVYPGYGGEAGVLAP